MLKATVYEDRLPFSRKGLSLVFAEGVLRWSGSGGVSCGVLVLRFQPFREVCPGSSDQNLDSERLIYIFRQLGSFFVCDMIKVPHVSRTDINTKISLTFPISNNFC